MINIDTSLNKKYVAGTGVDLNKTFTPIEDGEYTVRVKEVTPWVAKTSNVKVIQRDEKGKPILNEKGEKVTELVNDCTFYNCTAKLEIIGGEYDGRIVFHNLTTHPNMSFNIPQFLYGLGMKELSASEIQEKTKGKICIAEVYTDVYEKKVQDKETGLDKLEKRTINRVSKFKENNAATQKNDIEDLGI